MKTPAPPSVFAFGDAGPLPFLGHFRAEVAGPGSLLRVAGRWGGVGNAMEACALAGGVEQAVRRLVRSVERPDDRVMMLRGLWGELMEMAKHTPSAMQADFAVLIMASDGRGVTVSGTGLAGCWSVTHGLPPQPVVPSAHPLLSGLGMPPRRPGGMTLNRVPNVLFAELRHPMAPPRGLPAGDLFAAAGARR